MRRNAKTVELTQVARNLATTNTLTRHIGKDCLTHQVTIAISVTDSMETIWSSPEVLPIRRVNVVIVIWASCPKSTNLADDR